MARLNVAEVILFLGIILFAQSTTVFGRRSLSGPNLTAKVNGTTGALVMNETTTTQNSSDLLSEVQRAKEIMANIEKTTAASEAARVDDENAVESASLPVRMQLAHSGLGCGGVFTSQEHAWMCAGAGRSSK